MYRFFWGSVYFGIVLSSKVLVLDYYDISAWVAVNVGPLSL